MSGSGRARGQEPKGTVVDVLMAIGTAWRSLPGRDPVGADARAPEAPIERLIVGRLIADTLAARGPLPGAPSCRVSRSFATAQHWPTPAWVADLGMLWAAARFSPT